MPLPERPRDESDGADADEGDGSVGTSAPQRIDERWIDNVLGRNPRPPQQPATRPSPTPTPRATPTP